MPLSSEPHRLKSLAYQLDSFKYVCQVSDNIFAAAVPKDSSYQSIQDIVKDARRNAGMGVSYGTSDIEAVSKVELTHVPYKGDAPMLQDLLTNRLNFGALLASSLTSQIQTGSLRLLAVSSDRHHPPFPQVPMLTEAGLPVAQLSFGGLWAVHVTKQLLTTLKVMPMLEAMAIPNVSQHLNAENAFATNDFYATSADTMFDELFRWTQAMKPMRTPS